MAIKKELVERLLAVYTFKRLEELLGEDKRQRTQPINQKLPATVSYEFFRTNNEQTERQKVPGQACGGRKNCPVDRSGSAVSVCQ